MHGRRSIADGECCDVIYRRRQLRPVPSSGIIPCRRQGNVIIQHHAVLLMLMLMMLICALRDALGDGAALL